MRAMSVVGLVLIVACCEGARAEVRTWSDATGTYSVEAEFQGLEDGNVLLLLKDGNSLAVPLVKLSEKDREYVDLQQRGAAAFDNPQWMQRCLVLLTFDPPHLQSPDRPAVALDASGHEHAGRIRGASLASGRVGKALSFDGRDDVLELETLYSAITQKRRELSIALWIRRSNPKLGMVFDAGFYGESVTMTVQANQARFLVTPRAGGVALPFHLPADDRWHHVVLVWTGASQVAYVDGREVAEQKTKRGTLTPESLGGQPTVFLGTQVKADRRGERYFQGALDEFAVFAQALTADQVVALHRQAERDQSLAALLPSSPAATGAAPMPKPPATSPTEWKLAVKKLHTIPAHDRSVSRIAFSDDGTMLASSSYREAKVWKVSDRTSTGRFEAEDFNVVSLTFVPGEQKLLVSADALRFWDARTNELTDHVATDAFLVMGLTYSADGSVLMAIDGKQISLWEQDEELAPLEFERAVKAADLSVDGSLAAAVTDGQIAVRESRGGKPLFTAAGPEKNARSAAFSADGRWLAVSSNEAEILLYDVEARKAAGVLEGHTSSVFDVEFIPGTAILVSSGGSREGRQDRTARLWDVAARKQLAVLELGETYGQCSAVSPDGRLLAIGCQDGSIQFWQLAE